MRHLTPALALPFLLACGGATTDDVTTAGGDAAFVAHGATVYAEAGCASCHGAATGEGGAVLEGAPTFDTFVARFGLSADARPEAIALLASGTVHDTSHDDEHPFEGFEQFVLTTRLYGELIAGDDHSGFLARMELGGEMPEWGDTLTQRDIDAVMAFLIDAGE